MRFSMRFNLFLRSFFLQTGWNYMKYQNLGLTFVMLPFLKETYQNDRDALPSVLQRYLEIFNTQPVMASFCFGALARQEEEKMSFSCWCRASRRERYFPLNFSRRTLTG